MKFGKLVICQCFYSERVLIAIISEFGYMRVRKTCMPHLV